MLKTKTHQLVAAGLFVAIGLILPYFTAHAFRIPGTILLPMHIPVLLCGLLCGPRFGALSGLVIPVLSCIITGMPAVYPMLPIMVVQLFLMGFVSGVLYQKVKWNIYLSLISAMICGWAFYGLMFDILLLTAAGGLQALSVTSAVVQGLPGTAVQLVLIPVIILILKRYLNSIQSKKKTDDILDRALELINCDKISCVVVKDNMIIHTADGRGVSPLLDIYLNEAEKLNNAFVVDKIIGKAAAMILVLGKAKRVYGIVMSETGRAYLERHNIKTEYGRCVDIISNREGNGICPIEKSVINIDDLHEGLAVIRSTVDDIKKAGSIQKFV